MEELPYSLQQELNNQMQQKKFANVPFLCKRDVCFLKWISPIIQSSTYEVSQFVYKEGEAVKKSKCTPLKINIVFFIVRGTI